MARTLKYTIPQVKKALRLNNGLLLPTSKTLGCDRQTIYNYLNRFPELREFKEQVVEETLDKAETLLLKKAFEEEETTALIFLLKSIGKKRGYGYQVDVNKTNTSEITVRIVEEPSLPAPAPETVALPEADYYELPTEDTEVIETVLVDLVEDDDG